MSSLSRELVFLMLQFLDEEKFKDTVHELEKESSFYFNMRYFEDMVTNGEWDELEKYLHGFTKFDDNRYSMKIFFEIRKQKYLEALDRHDHPKAVEILLTDLKSFSNLNGELYKELTLLLTLNSFRENEQLSKYGDARSARAIMSMELKKLIEANPLFRDKLQFPSFKSSRLRTLINQSLNWQHQLCKNPRTNADIKTLFVDHMCGQPNGARALSSVTNPLAGSMPKVGGFPPSGAHGPFQPAPAGFTAHLVGLPANSSSVPHQTASAGPIGLTAPNSSASLVKRPRTATDSSSVDYQTTDSDLVRKRSQPLVIGNEVNNMPMGILPMTYPGQSQTPMHSPDDLPKTVVSNLNQGSAVTSMDFHPSQHYLLLVGTNAGEISIWEVVSKEKLVHKNFKVELSRCSGILRAALEAECNASVNRVMWSPDGSLLGAAYSKHIVHLFSYHGGSDLRNHLEIEAHVGSVNDLAFAHPGKQLCVVTCGEDKAIKVWDATNGTKLYTFEGHEAPVHSVYPHHKEQMPFIFSTSFDGKIKAWLYDSIGCRVDYDAPGHCRTTMAYSANGARLFSCGTNKEGESFLVEWNESEGSVKRSYIGLGKRALGVVQFDTLRNKFLATGDESVIKFWDMDNVNVLTTTDAEGGLPASPCIRFNKDGILLAVSTSDNGIKVLANTDGVRQVRSFESRTLDSARLTSGSAGKAPFLGSFPSSGPMAWTNGMVERNAPVTAIVGLNSENRSLPHANPVMDKSKSWRPTEIDDPSQLRSLCLPLPDHMSTVRIIQMMYTNSGGALLALAYDAIHKLWKWQMNERNVSGKATASIAPHLWTPKNGVLMTNEIAQASPEEAVPCFALSKNDSYVMSASGGRISLFNMMTFKTMTTFMSPPPATTSLAFHPQDNNIIAIGMEDSTIKLYNVRVDEVIVKLQGHEKRVTGLTFSNVLNILISAGADSQLCVWSTDRWDKQASKFLQMPTGQAPKLLSHTRVQFHHDQVHVMAVHETQVAIYEAPKLEGVRQWFPARQSSGAITDAGYSCDSQTIYVSFENASVAILVAATLTLRCIINPSSYLPSNPSNKVYPVAVATHPSEPNQFALGLTDGGVHVFEPLEPEANWGNPPPGELSAGPSQATGASDQQSR